MLWLFLVYREIEKGPEPEASLGVNSPALAQAD